MLPHLWARCGHNPNLSMRMAGGEHMTAVEIYEKPKAGDRFWCWSLAVSQAEGSALWCAVLTVVNQGSPTMGREMETVLASDSTAQHAIEAVIKKSCWRTDIAASLDLTLGEED